MRNAFAALLFLITNGCYQPLYVQQGQPVLDSHTCEEAATKYDWKSMADLEQSQAHANLAECFLLNAERIFLYEPPTSIYDAEEQCARAYEHLQQVSAAESGTEISYLVQRANVSCDKIVRAAHEPGNQMDFE